VARGRIRGRLVTGYPPLAIGCDRSAEWLRSGDALRLVASSRLISGRRASKPMPSANAPVPLNREPHQGANALGS
jgi:hypothetical protein